MNALQVKQVGQEVRDAVDGVQRCLVQSSTTACRPFRLTQQDLRTINHILTTLTTKQREIRFCLDHGNDEQLEQVNSRSSLILVGKRNTYKHICQGENGFLRDLFEIAQSERLVNASTSGQSMPRRCISWMKLLSLSASPPFNARP